MSSQCPVPKLAGAAHLLVPLGPGEGALVCRCCGWIEVLEPAGPRPRDVVRQTFHATLSDDQELLLHIEISEGDWMAGTAASIMILRDIAMSGMLDRVSVTYRHEDGMVYRGVRFARVESR